MSDAATRIFSVLPVLGHPRDSKRIRMLQDAGFVVEAAAFDRGNHAARLPECSVEDLGTIAHGRYLQRFLRLPRVFPILRAGVRRNDVVYASGPDMALMAVLSGIGLGRPVVLEVGDIRRIQVSSGLVGSLARLIERWLLSRCALLVVTAPGFVDEYYAKRLKTRIQTLVIENKLEPESASDQRGSRPGGSSGKPNQPIRVGYFGMLRCEWSLQVLETLVLKHPMQFSVLIAGTPLDQSDLQQRVSNIPNVEYVGPYRSPDDLPGLYRDIDLSWAAYPGPDKGDPDWWLARAICRSNRLYESCRYETPVVSVEGSGDAVEVRKHDIGLVIVDQDVEAVVDVLAHLRHSDLEGWRRNMAELPREVYEYTTEGERLREAIQNCVESRRSRKHGTA